MTPLLSAIYEGHKECVSLLLKAVCTFHVRVEAWTQKPEKVVYEMLCKKTIFKDKSVATSRKTNKRVTAGLDVPATELLPVVEGRPT